MNADLFGLEQQPPRTNSRPEAAAAPRRVPKPAARLSHPGEGEIVG